jgi:Tol biopolymer transport system component
MKNLLLTSILLLILITGSALAFDERIYIAELIMENDLETARTLISVFKPDGTNLKETLINGVMARVSPDGKFIIYLELKKDNPWEIVLADSEGKKVKNLEFKRPPKHIGYPRPTNLNWSPDGEKIAIVSGILTFIDVSVYNLKTNRLKTMYSGNTSSSEEVYFYTAKWLPDSKRILIAGADGTRIINSETNEEILVSKESVMAYLSGDGKKIIYSPQLNKIHMDAAGFKSPFEIYQYDTEKGRSDLLMVLDMPPLMAILNQDGRYLALQTMSIKEPTISIIDLMEKKVSKVDTKRLFIFPKKFSPYVKNFVVCMALQENEETIQYGIFNLNSGEFRVLRESHSKGLKGEKGLVLFMGFDWYDWR